MKRYLPIAVALALCGCGSRGKEAARTAPDAGTVSAAAAPAKTDPRPVIVCFGDSLTAGLGLEPGQTYPDNLQQELDRRGYRYRVANFGVSGDTTQDGLARLPLVVAEKPAIVVLELGANDGLRGQPVAVTKQNLAQIIEALQGAGARVLLAGITLPPNYGPQYIHSFEQVFRDLAAQYKLPLIPFLLEGVGGHSQLMQRDGLHPTAEGARIVTATVLKYLTPMLSK